MYENIYLIEFFQSQECKYRKIGKIAKNAIFACNFANFGVFCNFANFELFALLGFTSTKKCVNSLSSSKNTRKMTVIKTLMARLAYTRKKFRGNNLQRNYYIHWIHKIFSKIFQKTFFFVISTHELYLLRLIVENHSYSTYSITIYDILTKITWNAWNHLFHY